MLYIHDRCSICLWPGTTLFSVLLGLFAVVLGRYGGASDLAVASPVANRHGAAVEPLMGYFVPRGLRHRAICASIVCISYSIFII